MYSRTKKSPISSSAVSRGGFLGLFASLPLRFRRGRWRSLECSLAKSWLRILTYLEFAVPRAQKRPTSPAVAFGPPARKDPKRFLHNELCMDTSLEDDHPAAGGHALNLSALHPMISRKMKEESPGESPGPATPPQLRRRTRRKRQDLGVRLVDKQVRGGAPANGRWFVTLPPC